MVEAKDVATIDRPSLEVTTQMVHGVGIFTYLGDENHTLNRSLQHTSTFLQKTNKPQPASLRIFSDNTPKEP
jgi:hypothetical protein